ncbi:MAG: ABC transporter substrate-binding protein [Paludibacteraceae bacterium]|nr:ABC transporter substrate-binding protein [Paludibacteraceae bacterium]
MNRFYRCVIFLLLMSAVWGCQTKQTENSVPLSNKYATGFRITEEDSCLLLEVMEPYTTYRISQPLQRLGTSSVTQVGFLNELNALNSIVAVCNPELIYTSLPGKPMGLGDSMKPSAEQALQANLDAFLVVSYGQSNPEAERLEKLGVRTIYINEWRESTPLARAEWIRFVGALVGRLPEADSIFAEIEQRYKTTSVAHQKHQKDSCSVMVGNNFRGTWYMPSGHTYMGYLLKDAGAAYPYYSDIREESIPLTIEQVLHQFTEADAWIGAQAASLDELKELDEKHTWFRAYKNGRVYNWRGQFREGRNNFWERGVVHPEEILEDIVAILENTDDEQLHYAKRLR